MNDGAAHAALGDGAACRSQSASIWSGRAGARLAGALCVLTVGALLLRLPFRIDYAEEIDSLRFILALDRFDLAALRPHFPGYPVFIAFARAVRWLGARDATQALALTVAISGALLVVPLVAMARMLFGTRAGWVAGALVAINPLLWLYSLKLLSDMVGLAMLFAGLALLLRGCRAALCERGLWQGARAAAVADDGRTWLGAGSFVLGLALGVRLSYFPFALSALVLLLWLRRPLLRNIAWGTLGILLWLVPMALATPWDALISVATAQTHGHFAHWGGTVASQSDLGLRAQTLLWMLTAHGLGTWWTERSPWLLLPTIALVALVALGLRAGGRPRRPGLVLWAAMTVPYLVWAYFGQNVTAKPRHALPLVVLALLATAVCGASMLRGRGARHWVGAVLLAVWLAGQAVTGFALAHAHQRQPSNAALLARDVGRHCTASRRAPLVVYTAAFRQLVERAAPCAEVLVMRHVSGVKRDLARRPTGTLAFVSSDVSHVERLRRPAYRRYRRNRYIQHVHRKLALYRIEVSRGR